MNAARQLIADAHRQGASFHLTGDRLRLVPDAGRDLSPDLIESAKALRSDVLAILSPPHRAANSAERSEQVASFATRKNRDAQRAGLTDRWCDCGSLASLAWPRGRTSFADVWRCLDCSRSEGWLQ